MKKILVLVFFLSISGCGYFVTKEEFNVLQRQTINLERELKTTSTALSSEAGEIKSTTTRLNELHEQLRKSFADTNVRIDELDLAISKLKGEIDNFKLDAKENQQRNESLFKMQTEFIQRLNGNINQLQNDILEIKKEFSAFKNISSEIGYLKQRIVELEQKQEDMSKNKVEKETQISKQQLYDNALELYNRGDYENAIVAFESFLAVYAQDALSDNALYWIGESYYAQKKYKEALTYFHRIITDFPNADKVPSALFKEALTLEQLGMEKEADGAIKELIYRFPYSHEAIEAKKRVKKR